MSYATVQELATALGIAATAGNTESLQACVDAAAVEIDHYIDAADTIAGTATWRFAAAGDTDPGPGNACLNDATPTLATAILISELDAVGADMAVTLSGIIANDLFTMNEAVTSRYYGFRVTGSAFDAGAFFRIPIAFLESSAPPPKFDPAELVTFVFARTAQPIGNPLANRVNVVRGVEWWKSNAAAFGVIGFDQVGSLQAPRDSFLRHQKELMPLKQRFGVA